MNPPNTDVDRRRFLAAAGVALGGAAAASGTGLAGLFARTAYAGEGGSPAVDPEADYGPLSPKRPVAAEAPASADTAYLALPDGFGYTVFGAEGHRMTDGRPTPRAHDGMAAFARPGGRVRLVRNHEDRSDPAQARAEGGARAHPAYDPAGRGATTTLEIAITPGGYPMPVADMVSIAGTIVNCAGGPTPWGSWLTCEETTAGRGDGWDRDHGYVFEVPAASTRPAPPVPLKSMGRFTHEAVAVDPGTGAVYETEDNNPAGFYRFLPHRPGRLAAGGKLQMLAVDGQPGADLRGAGDEGARYPVRWVDIDEPDPADPGADGLAVYHQGRARGGAAFTRLEGCWYGASAIYLNSTDGGPAGHGQVWEYRPTSSETGELTLIVAAPNPGVLDAPDNLTVSPRGGILTCEDGGAGNYLRGVLATGDTYDFAHNQLNQRETAGACFATSPALRARHPDTGGQILFVNIQGDTAPDGPGNLGYTFAIWGPWTTGSL